MLIGKKNVDRNSAHFVFDSNDRLRGHSRKLFKPRAYTRTCLRKKTHSVRASSTKGNSLPQDVVDSTSINTFKNRRENFRNDVDIQH